MTSALLLLAAIPAAPVTDVKLPHGFTAHFYSDQKLANDIYTMTIDDAGRVFVAGRGYVRQLIDDNGDGTADRAVDVVTGLKDGPMGLLVEGDSIYVVADGGLKRYRPNQKPEVLYAVKTAGEHEAHGVRRGPDGWLYLMCGNMSGVKKEHLDPDRSPVKNPIAGSLLRIRPNGKTIEAVADGFRNAYGFDFSLDGEPFTFDSDNERCVGLPWYEPCRFYHIVPGGNYGWRSPQLSQTWRKPPYFADVVPPVGVTGRGSPTGVACYRNTLFPGPYRGGFFIADWTFGKVWFVPLEKKHSTYEGKPEVFLEAIGESGFAPTALAVHPKTGELFVSIGGRGTRGAVYRITHSRGGPANELPIAKRSLEWSESEGKEWLADAVGNDAMKRRHALDMMLRYRDKLGWGHFLGDAVKPNLSHDDALLRASAARLAVRAAAPIDGLRDIRSRLTLDMLLAAENPDGCLELALAVIESPKASVELKLLATRVVQIALGDLGAPGTMGTVGEGYTFGQPVPRPTAERVMQVVRNVIGKPDGGKKLPSTPELDRELARIVGGVAGYADKDKGHHYFNAEWMRDKMLDEKGTRAEDDFHYLAAMSRMHPRMLNDVDEGVKYGLIRMDQRLDQLKTHRDRNWSLRWDEVVEGLVSKHDYMSSPGAWGRDRELKRPAHLTIIRHLKQSAVDRANQVADMIWARSNEAWPPAAIAMLEPLKPGSARTVMRRLWNRGMDDAILALLAREPQAEDGPKFVVGLRSNNPNVVKLSATALVKLEASKDAADVLAAIVALRKLPDDKGPREALVALLKQRTGQNHADAKAWAAWFATAHPEQAAKLNAADGFDPAAWKKREASIPWEKGDAVLGRAASAKATCAACHDGVGAIGPSLAGVGKRFSRDDLLTSILQPSRDVASRYRPTRIATKDEKIHIGMIVYEAVSGVILQTGPDAVVRIAGDQIESQKLLDTSLMPAGLLEKLTDQEIADLIAYLRSG